MLRVFGGLFVSGKKILGLIGGEPEILHGCFRFGLGVGDAVFFQGVIVGIGLLAGMGKEIQLIVKEIRLSRAFGAAREKRLPLVLDALAHLWRDIDLPDWPCPDGNSGCFVVIGKSTNGRIGRIKVALLNFGPPLLDVLADFLGQDLIVEALHPFPANLEINSAKDGCSGEGIFLALSLGDFIGNFLSDIICEVVFLENPEAGPLTVSALGDEFNFV